MMLLWTYLICEVKNHALDVVSRSKRLEQPVVEIIVAIKNCAPGQTESRGEEEWGGNT